MLSIAVLPAACTKLLTHARFETFLSLSPYLTEKTVDAHWFLQPRLATHEDNAKPVITVTGMWLASRLLDIAIGRLNFIITFYAVVVLYVPIISRFYVIG
jgi:hypothetical protein